MNADRPMEHMPGVCSRDLQVATPVAPSLSSEDGFSASLSLASALSLAQVLFRTHGWQKVPLPPPASTAGGGLSEGVGNVRVRCAPHDMLGWGKTITPGQFLTHPNPGSKRIR